MNDLPEADNFRKRLSLDAKVAGMLDSIIKQFTHRGLVVCANSEFDQVFITDHEGRVIDCKRVANDGDWQMKEVRNWIEETTEAHPEDA